MTNTEYAMRALRVWYNESGLDFKGITFDQAVDFLVNKSEPRRLYLDLFGDSVKTVGEYKAHDAMFTLGELNNGKIPDPAYFSEMLYDRVDPSRLENFVPLVADSLTDSAATIVKTVSSYGGFGLKYGFYLALAGAALYVFVNAGGAKLVRK